VVNAICSLKEGDKVYILIAFKQHKNRDIKEELNILLQKGFSRIYKKGEILRIEDILANNQYSLINKDCSVLVDRIVVKEFDDDDKHRLADSIGTAFYEGEGDVYIDVNGERQLHFNNRFELD
jgi:excinuclease ABC subunit A